MKKIKINEKTFQWLLLALVFILVLAWSLTAGHIGGPDEHERYAIAKYLYENPGKLPRGETPEVRNDIWGVSYAFYPILSYMVSAVFMWIAGFLGVSGDGLLYAARLADVLFITAAAWFVIRSARRLFEGEKRWLFSVMVMFLPGFQFLGTYVNTDSLALLAAAVILYAWACYLDEGWTWKNCMFLALGMGVCFLSYYNAYGWILFSFFFFCATVLLCTDSPWKARWKFLFSRGFAIAGITFAVSGWWFLRNYFLYDGDILGRKAGAAYAEQYAKEGYKPSQHLTPFNQGWSWKEFFLYQNPGWEHNWVMMVLVSFIGTFGLLDIYMDENVSKLYLLFLIVGWFGVLLMMRAFYWRRNEIAITRAVENGRPVIRKQISIYKEWDKKGVFHLAMMGAMITPVLLLLSYAYYNDNQAQGRYIMAGIYPFMYFVTCGYGKLLERFIKKESIRTWFYRITCALWIVGAVLNYFFIIIPAYQA